MSTASTQVDPLSGRVTLDGFNLPDGRIPTFAAASISDERWNGFALPRFTSETVAIMVEIFNRAGHGAGYDAERDAFYFAVEGSLEGQPYDKSVDYDAIGDGYPPFEVRGKDGDGLYDLGGSWAWSRAEDFGGHENDAQYIRAEELALMLQRDPDLRLGLPPEREVARERGL